MINNNLPSLKKNDWRYYFVKYPRIVRYYPGFIDSNNMVILLEKPATKGFYVPHRLNGKQLTGYHACALYLEVSIWLSGNMNYVTRGKDTDELSCLSFKSGAMVKIFPDDLVQVCYYRDVPITKTIADKANIIWKTQTIDDLDYVDQLELVSRNVLQAEQECGV